VRRTWLGMTALGILAGFLIVLFIFFSWYPKIYKGVVLEGVDLSGYSREEVTQLVTSWQPKYQNKSIVVFYNDTKSQVDAGTIDLDIDVNATLDEVWNYGRRGSWWERIKEIRTGWEDGYPISLAIKYNEIKLDSLVGQWKDMIDRPPRNAVINLWTKKIVPHELGYALESDVVRPLILEAFTKSDNNAITLPVKVLQPKVTMEDITNAGMKEILSSYTTTFNSEDANRTDNIKLAALKANGTILYPGKIFSFNEIVGPREKEYGFKEALEIVDGEFVPGVGGGICQVSSTLYNAVLLANLDIVERYNHSKPLSYVPLGQDATVAYDVLDFKFRNNTDGPLLIMTEVEDNKLVVGILGQHLLTQKVEIQHEDRQTIPPSIVKKEDPNLYLGETRIDQEGKPGYKVTTLRVVWSKGRQISREVLSKDEYLGDDTIVKIGTKVPPFVEKDKKKTGQVSAK
jgi:vancomycin resistance protein YoaR